MLVPVDEIGSALRPRPRVHTCILPCARRIRQSDGPRQPRRCVVGLRIQAGERLLRRRCGGQAAKLQRRGELRAPAEERRQYAACVGHFDGAGWRGGGGVFCGPGTLALTTLALAVV